MMRSIIAILIVFSILFVDISYGTYRSVIIIGSGPAGIGAATRLLENNFTDFLLLEAENRIGGRIFSVSFGESIVDLGAEWCHGEKDNVVFERVNHLNLLKSNEDQSHASFYSKFPIDTNVTNELDDIFESLYFDDNYEGVNNELSLQEHFVQRYNDSISKLYGNNQTLLEYAVDCTDFYVRAICSNEGCFKLSDVSAQSDYIQSEGNQILSWNGKGYKTFLDVLMKKYPNPKESLPIDDKILLEKEVVNINWQNNIGQNNSTHKVSVKCSNGEIYYADRVILTVSLGVLKANAKSLFSPDLPVNKLKAIEDIGFGALNKLFLLYEEQWWPKNVQYFGFIWSKEDREKLSKEGRSWLLDMFCVITVEKNKNALEFWIAGENVPKIENLSDDDLLSAVEYIFDVFFKNNTNRPKPIQILRTNWFTQPHFRGSYSYESIKSAQNTLMRSDLAEPLSNGDENFPVLHFAGEATSIHHFSTVHGATETGFREADRILNKK